jgi:hypothetical protein
MIGTQHDLVHKPMPALRDLRNRIAHHEPIFSRLLAANIRPSSR